MTNKNRKILIVDDSQKMRDLLGGMLRDEGYEEIFYAASATEAYEILGLDGVGRKRKFLGVDLILLDIMMPEIDGIEACRSIKSYGFFRDVPIVMVTNCDGADVLRRAFAAGAIDYIVKPANDTELLARIRSFLKLKYEMDARKAREKELLAVTTKLRKANTTLQRLSYIDGLTDIGNRRYFDELYDKEWRRARREKIPLALIMVDIDLFKLFNDTYGHQAGDECLKDVAQAINDALKRPVDFVARYGGEEFVVILPDTDVEGATIVADNISAEVAALKILHADSSVHELVTVSMGIAAIVPHADVNGEDLLRYADAALYDAKGLGRNRIVRHPD